MNLWSIEVGHSLLPVHDHCVQSCLAWFVGASSEPDGAVTLKVFTLGTSCLKTNYKLRNIDTSTKLNDFHEPQQHLARMHPHWQLSRRWRLPLWTPRCSPRSVSSSGTRSHPRPLHRETRREQRPRGWRGRRPPRCRASGSSWLRRERIYLGEFRFRKFQSLHCLHLCGLTFDNWRQTRQTGFRIGSTINTNGILVTESMLMDHLTIT